MNPYQIGVGGFITVSLYVVILAFLWRSAAAMFASSDNPTLQSLGGAMGSSL